MSNSQAHRITFGATPGHAWAVFQGRMIADSDRAVLLLEGSIPPVCYFPESDIDFEFLTQTDQRTHCPFKGEASYWTLDIDGRVEHNIAWAYKDPLLEVMQIKGHLAFYADRVDALVVDHSDPRAAR